MNMLLSNVQNVNRKSLINQRFHDHNPCTMVYKLVRLLIGEDKDFIKQIKSELEKK